jgi:hypothetical protein
MTVTSREVTARDFAIFQFKLFLDGMKDLVAFNLTIVAIILDFISGHGKRPRLFYSVVRASKRFDTWLNLHSVVERMDELAKEDPLLEDATLEEGSLDSELEKLVQKAMEKGRSLSDGSGPKG